MSKKETEVYHLWETKYKTDKKTRGRGKSNEMHTGIREMQRETGLDDKSIRTYLQAHEARLRLAQKFPAKKSSIDRLSSRMLAKVWKEVAERTEVLSISFRLSPARVITLWPDSSHEVSMSMWRAEGWAVERVEHLVGHPDFIARRDEETVYVEAKWETDALRAEQIQWMVSHPQFQVVVHVLFRAQPSYTNESLES